MVIFEIFFFSPFCQFYWWLVREIWGLSSEAILVAVLAPLCFSFQTHLEYSSELLMVNSFLTLAVFETHVQLNELILSLIGGDTVDSTMIYILCWVISSSFCHIGRAKISKIMLFLANPNTKLLLLFLLSGSSLL